MDSNYRITVAESQVLASTIAAELKGGEIFALTGPLGSGKTTFTQALGAALGVKNHITSPTFVVMQQYETKKISPTTGRPLMLYHLDLYRTSNFTEVVALGITEWWHEPDSITVIEWADKIAGHLPLETIHIAFQPLSV
jgi:tRNA threonylcarbamoyladenosine biosynthesis protein TsaE